jgi:membrane associated rhomboid family serine protease
MRKNQRRKRVRGKRERIFNLPGVVLAAVVLLLGIHGLRQWLPESTDVGILVNFAFVPGRFTFAFDPQRMIPVIEAFAGKDQMHADVAQLFLGNGTALWWTSLTYALLHGSWMHVGFNCLWLVAFGAAVARRFGNLRFLLFCVATAAAGALVHYLTHMEDLQPVIGASAIVSGTMAAALRFVFQPGAPIGDFSGSLQLRPDEFAYRQPALPLRGIITDRRAMAFLVAWFFVNLLFGMAPSLIGLGGETIAWQAHVGGFLVGLFGFPIFDRPVPAPAEPMAKQDAAD